MPIFADNWNSRTVGASYANGDQSAIGPPIINDWGLTAINGYANWTFSGFGAQIGHDSVLGYNTFDFISAAGSIAHQTSGHYNTFTIYLLLYSVNGFGNGIEVLNKDPDVTKSGSVSLFSIIFEGDGSVTLFFPFTKDNGSQFRADNSAFHTPYAIIPQNDWSLLQVTVTLTGIGGYVTASVQAALNGIECISNTITTGYLITQMFDNNATANFFRFNSNGNFGLFSNISMVAGVETLGKWPDYDVVPTGVQKGKISQALLEVLEATSGGNLVVSQAVLEDIRIPIPTCYVSQAVIELIKASSGSPPPPPTGVEWIVKEV